MAEKPVKKAVKASDRRRGDDAVAKAVKSLDASNIGVEKALQYVGDGLKAIQRQRRTDTRRTLVLAFVVLVLLGGLALNAYEGRQARHKLVTQSDVQTQTLTILKDATGPEAQAEGAARLLEAFKQIDCNNQRAIQRAMAQLGHNYELTEECR